MSSSNVDHCKRLLKELLCGLFDVFVFIVSAQLMKCLQHLLIVFDVYTVFCWGMLFLLSKSGWVRNCFLSKMYFLQFGSNITGLINKSALQSVVVVIAYLLPMILKILCWWQVLRSACYYWSQRVIFKTLNQLNWLLHKTIHFFQAFDTPDVVTSAGQNDVNAMKSQLKRA